MNETTHGEPAATDDPSAWAEIIAELRAKVAQLEAEIDAAMDILTPIIPRMPDNMIHAVKMTVDGYRQVSEDLERDSRRVRDLIAVINTLKEQLALAIGK